MVHINMLADVEAIPNLEAWRFRVKIIRAYPSYVVGIRDPFWNYILADEAGSKIEMMICPVDAKRFQGLENHEGSWIEIFRVEIERSYSGFKPTNSRYKISTLKGTTINLIAPLNNNHFMEFKSIQHIRHTTNMDNPIDTMGVVFNTQPIEVFTGNPRRTRMVFYIRDNIEQQIKCVVTGDNVYAFRNQLANVMGPREVIVVLKMWRIYGFLSGDTERWLEAEIGLSDFRFNHVMEEVDDFRRELANSDPYVAKYGPL